MSQYNRFISDYYDFYWQSLDIDVKCFIYIAQSFSNSNIIDESLYILETYKSLKSVELQLMNKPQ